MRAVWVMLTAALWAGCQPPAQRAPERVSPVRAETTLGVPIPMTSAEVAEEQRRGTLVDTIVLTSTRLELSVGEEYNLLRLRPVGRDRSGQVVPSLVPTFVRHETPVYEIDLITLRALRAGVDTLYVEALPREPSIDLVPRRPSTRVTVVVRP